MVAVIHCPVVFHEPVVTNKICIYGGAQMKIEFDVFNKSGHDFNNCNQCILIKE